MKIAFVMTDINQLGGVERVVALLSEIFVEKLGHQVTILSCESRYTNTETPITYPFDKIKVVHLSQQWDSDSFVINNSLSQKTLFKYCLLRNIKQYLRKNPQDIILGTVCWQNCFLPFFSNGAKVAACDHGAFNFIPWIYRMIARICYPFCDALISLTNGNLSHYSFMPDNKKFVIPNPVSFCTDKRSSCENKSFLTLARFTEEKGLDIQLQIAAKIKDHLPDWRMDIYGEGEDEEKLKCLSKQLGLENFVCFHPATHQVEEKLLQSSIYVMSSLHEGFGMVLLESQICGVPPVSFDCTYGPSDIITDGKDGFLIPMGDTDLFAQKLILLARDEKLRKEMGKNAQISSLRFSEDKIAKLWQNLFEKLSNK